MPSGAGRQRPVGTKACCSSLLGGVWRHKGGSVMARRTVLDLLDAAAGQRGVLRFLGPGAQDVRFAQLWQDAHAVGARLARRVGRGGTVAGILDASPACLTALLGAWRVGLTFASVPHPARGVSADEYAHQVETMCKLVGADLVLVESAYVDAVPQTSVDVACYDAYGSGPGASVGDDAGRFVQFTSGSTADPKGIRLSLE